MKKLNSQQVLRHLRENEHNYLAHYFQGGTCYDDEGNECGDFSQLVLDNLLNKKLIKLIGDSRQLWSDGYYNLEN